MNKEKGFAPATIILFYMAISFVVILIVYNSKFDKAKYTGNYVDDGLIASTLAAATIDLEEYGTSEHIVCNMEQSYLNFCETLKINLNLDSNFISKSDLIDGQVIVTRFTIYNVIDNNIEEISKDRYGYENKVIHENLVGKISTPNNIVINETTVYAEIGFRLKDDLMGKEQVIMSHSVDITDKID